MSGDPTRAGPQLHTIRAVGAVTRGLCSLRRGAMVGIRGPFGTAWPVERAEGEDLVLVAGGIGLAPLRPVIYELLAHRRRYGRIVILYGARSRGDMIFARELEAWRGRFDLDLQATVDHSTGDWLGHVGVVTSLIPRAGFDPSQTIAMVCGPEVMMRFTLRALAERGVAGERIFLSMERNMKCGIGLCGHCQFGPSFVCRDGAVFALPQVEKLLAVREV
jgi:NAD(P)H-flavin reductase